MSMTPVSMVRRTCLLVVIGLAAGWPGRPAAAGPQAAPERETPALAPALGSAPPLLVARGPGRAAVFTAFGSRLRVDFDTQGVTFTQYGPARSVVTGPGAREDGIRFRRGSDGVALGRPILPVAPPKAMQRWRFEGARAVAPRASGWLPTRFNRLRGPAADWELARPCATGLVYPELWPGVDLRVAVEAEGLALRLEAEDSASLARARIAVEGGGLVEAGGALGLSLPWGKVASWQGLSDEPAAASSDRTRLMSASAPLALGFIYAGQWGLPAGERGLGIAVDAAGAAYLTGETADESEDVDAYVAKVRPDGSGLAYLTVLGGDGYDAGYDIDVDAGGHAYLAGATTSKQATLPVLMGPDLTYNGGDMDSLVAKLDADGQPVFVGYLGGEQIDFAEGIAVNAAGEAHVTGVVQSNESSFPVREGPDLTFNGDSGDTDCFVVKLRAVPDDRQAVRNVIYGGYIGGNNHDIGVFPIPGSDDFFVTAGHIAVDAAGAAYVSGMTLSRQDSFPDGDGFGPLRGPDRSFGGQWDAFIAKVKPDGKDLAWAGYAGGNGEEHGNGVGVDAAGAVYFSGQTNSPPLSLGVKVGPDLTPNGKIDALAAKVNPDGESYAYLGYIGGARDEVGSGATVSPEGELIIAGYTDSAEDTLPVVQGPDLSYNDATVGEGDALLVRVKADPSAADPAANFVHLGYVGGAQYDQAFWVDQGPGGQLYVVGDSESGPDSFPGGQGKGALPGLWPDEGGNGDAFVVKVGEPELPHPSPTPLPSPSTGPPSASPSTPPEATPTALSTPLPTVATQPPLAPTASATARSTGLPAPRHRIYLPLLER